MKLSVIFALLFVSVLGSADKNSSDVFEPAWNAWIDTHLDLVTRQNRNVPWRLIRNNEANFNASPFNSNRPTRFLIHGWWEDGVFTRDLNLATARFLLDHHDFNVIFVDWSAGADTITSFIAAERTRDIGTFVGQFMRWVAFDLRRMSYDDVHVIGFGMGAHIAGFAGQETSTRPPHGRFNTIIGLDPYGKHFENRIPAFRLDAIDAYYVETINTNGPGPLGLGFGLGMNVGHANFYPNGGEDQRGCTTNMCSHLRAIDYWMESIARNGFHSIACESERQAARENCNGPGGVWPQSELRPSNHEARLRGIFHYATNRNAPFAQGPFRT